MRADELRPGAVFRLPDGDPVQVIRTAEARPVIALGGSLVPAVRIDYQSPHRNAVGMLDHCGMMITAASTEMEIP